MKHVLLRNPRLTGIEYGMLRYLEQEIVKQTHASVVEVPSAIPPIQKRMGHGMRLGLFRKAFPQRKLNIEADVIWYILMGPENYELDLFHQWEVKAKYRIVYLFDTLPPQFELIKKLFSDQKFNIKITSFNDAIPYLEKLTKQPWKVYPQAVPESIFYPIEAERRVIDFSSYGRKYEPFHQALKEFCQASNLSYDYTTQNGKHLTVSEEEAYQQYAWHLQHSTCTISWPVEFTNPLRAGQLNPITCRWYEAASCGTIIMGNKPANESFDDFLTADLIYNVNPIGEKRSIWKQLEGFICCRDQLLKQRVDWYNSKGKDWTWKSRVRDILNMLELEQQYH